MEKLNIKSRVRTLEFRRIFALYLDVKNSLFDVRYLLIPLVIALWPVNNLFAQTTYAIDLTFTSRYHHKSLTLHNAPILRGSVYAFGQRQHLQWSVGLSSIVEIGPYHSTRSIGYDRHFGGEYNGWVQLSKQTNHAAFTFGFLGNLINQGPNSRGFALEREDSAELYLIAQLTRTRINPQVSAWYQVTPEAFWYLETAIPMRLQLWNQVLIPIGSLVVSPVAGWYPASHTISFDNEDFKLKGMTFWGIRSSIGGGLFALGKAKSSVTFEASWMRSTSRAVRIIDAMNTSTSKWSVSLCWLVQFASI